MKLLLADKDQAFLMILQSFLEDHGHQVETAENAIDCLKVLRTECPDVLVLGTLLWGGSEGVLATMEEDETLRKIPVILLLDSPARIKETSSNQVIQQLSRPIRLGTLAKHLADLQRAEHRTDNLQQASTADFCIQLQHHLTQLLDKVGISQIRTAG